MIQSAQNIEKFHNAEQMWFWFLYSKSVQGGLARRYGTPTRRACELLDVETLITKLYLAGRISAEQLNIMKQFGDKRRAPNQHAWNENHAADMWHRAMDVIEAAAKQRGWIE